MLRLILIIVFALWQLHRWGWLPACPFCAFKRTGTAWFFRFVRRRLHGPYALEVRQRIYAHACSVVKRDLAVTATFHRQAERLVKTQIPIVLPIRWQGPQITPPVLSPIITRNEHPMAAHSIDEQCPFVTPNGSDGVLWCGLKCGHEQQGFEHVDCYEATAGEVKNSWHTEWFLHNSDRAQEITGSRNHPIPQGVL